MSYQQIINQYADYDFPAFFKNVSAKTIDGALTGENISCRQFLSLLSLPAQNSLEQLAQKAHNLTVQYFGKTIQLYTPLYLSNYCDNQCVYCGFQANNHVRRKKLTLAQVKKEGQYLAKLGFKHILLLTGDSRNYSPPEYISDCAAILKKFFSSLAIEIYPLTEKEYNQLISQGVDSLTIYQETYDYSIYKQIHLSGPKTNYAFRLNAPERAAKQKIHAINIGSLLGLNDWRKEIFFTGLHAQYLQNKYSETEISVSIPRLQPHWGKFKIKYSVSDRDLTQIIIALRLFLPRVGITLSTRENRQLRENLIPLGITKMSAQSNTTVGGRINKTEQLEQFLIADNRSLKQIRTAIIKKGYQPVLKDWENK
jgi:2-iminoacetate synthase